MNHLFDLSLLRRNHARYRPAHGFLFDWAASQLAERLGDIRRDFPLALQIGPRGPDIRANGIGKWIRDIAFHEDLFPFAPHSLDLILSNLTLHSINDLPGALIQIRRALRPDGLFLAAMLGGETLYELRQVLYEAETMMKGGLSPRIHPFADKQQMGALMQRAGFALPVVDSDILSVTYPHLAALLQDLRYMGEGNAIAARNKTYPGRDFFRQVEAIYKSKHSDAEGRLLARFEIIFLIGWAPHENQQKPLRPGSAQHRLADALSTQEKKL